MTTHDVSDCIAMSEDGDWFAFPKTLRRGQVMAIMAENCMSWHDALGAYRVVAGHAHRPPEPPEDGWWEECPADTPGAVPAWIVRQRP